MKLSMSLTNNGETFVKKIDMTSQSQSINIISSDRLNTYECIWPSTTSN